MILGCHGLPHFATPASFMADCTYCKCKPHIALLNKSNDSTLIFERINYFHFVGFTELIINRRFLRTREISRQMVMYTNQLLLGIYSTSCALHLPKKKYEGFMHSFQFNVDQVSNIKFSFHHYGVLLNRLRMHSFKWNELRQWCKQTRKTWFSVVVGGNAARRKGELFLFRVMPIL